jgi:oligopeptide/dipeptide ABC transporter ATP-binding protein
MLEVERAWKSYRIGAFGGTELVAVRNVSFRMGAGEVVSLIGESGSGKTTIGRMILRLNAVTGGAIRVDGVDISTLSGRRLKEYYRTVQGVFQDPFSSYNPIFKADRVFAMVRDEYYPEARGETWRRRLHDALEAVALNPTDVLDKYPHQLSGGQLQRLLIARALLLDIKLLVADEIISMLDASTRVDVLNLLGDLKAKGLGILFITHDLSLGNYISEQTVILRRGSIVEMGATEHVFGNPLHPYTRALIASVPQLHRKWAEIEAELAARPAVQVGPCVYHAIYPGGSAGDGERPELAPAEDDHFVACFGADGGDECRAAAADEPAETIVEA